jgi:hypothetical protein
VVYQASAGVYVAKSSNRGQSFSTPTLVAGSIGAYNEVETKVGPEGNVYVTWAVDPGKIMFSRSTDGGATFATPTEVGFVSTLPHHLAVGATGVFIVSANPDVVFSNLNQGVGPFTVGTFGAAAFADVFVAPDGEVIVAWDSPSVSVQKSSNNGATFSAPVPIGAGAFYSTMAACLTPTQRYLYVGGVSSLSGSSNAGFRYDISTATLTTMPTTVISAAGSFRQLAADNIGNVVSLVQASSDGALSYQVSTDYGTTFGAPVAITPTATSADVALNAATGDLVVVYLSGGSIFATTTAGQLALAPEITVTESGNEVDDNGGVSFGPSSGSPVTKTFTITNTGVGVLTLANLTAPAGFEIAQDFGSTTVAANGGTTTFQITMQAGAGGTPFGSVTFTNNDGDESPFNFVVGADVAPTDITLTRASIAENNAPGATIGTLIATDANIGQTHTFNLVSSVGNDNADFTITGNVLSINAPANFEAKSSYTVRVRATDSGSPALSFEKDITITITDVTLPQTISFPALSGKTFGNAPFNVSATGGASGQPVTFGISGPATISGNTVTITGAGSVTITASQAGAGDFSAATPVPRTFTVAKAAQTITFDPLGGKTFGDADFAVSATGGASGEPVTFGVSGPATIAGNLVTITGAGEVTVTASQAGNTNYFAATPVPRTFTVAKAAQTITFGPLSGKTYGDAPFTVSAIGGASGLPVRFGISGPAIIAGNLVTIIGVGDVTVTASQAGNANYNAPADVVRTFTVSSPVPIVSITTGGPVPGAPVGTTFAVGGGLPGADEGDLGVANIKLPNGKTVKALVDSTGIIIKVGDLLAGADNAEIAKLDSMSFGVFQAELKVGTGSPAVTLANNKVVCFEDGSSVQVLARSGAAAPGGSTFKGFRASTGDAAGNVFIAANLNDPTNVDGGLWAIPAGGALTLLVKEGQTIDLGNGSKRVNAVASFPAGLKSQAEGRVHYGSDSIITRITLGADNAIVTIPADATSSADWTVLAMTGNDAPGAIGKYLTLGLPAAEGTNVVFSATLKTAGVVTTANNRIVVADGAVIARKGDAAPGTSGTFVVFEDVAAGATGQASFTANITGATTATDSGLWEYRSSTLSLVTIQGAAAPDLSGVTIAGISRFAQPGGGLGPVFTATLGGATTTTNVALFGVPVIGGSALNLARTGDMFDINGAMRKLTSFTALKMDLGNEGVARGYTDTTVFMLGSFGTMRSALIELPVAP